MCVTALAWGAHPDWPLVAIGNRDEFHERPAAPLAEWDENQGIIAGRDLQSGGTWLGVSKEARFVLVTNLRGFGTPDPSKRSRGELVTRLLSGTADPADEAALALDEYNPFNLLQVSAGEAHFLTNRPNPVSTRLGHGIYGLSNGMLDEPWAKTIQLKSAVQDWLNSATEDFDLLFAALASKRVADIGLHPTAPSDISIEASETPPFIRHPLYGTRCSTVVAVNRLGKGRIVERSFAADASASGETAFDFEWNQSAIRV